MSDEDDLYGVTPPPIPDELAERLLSGIGSGAEVDSTAELEALLCALRAPAEPSELSGMDAMVSAFQSAVVTQVAGPSTARTRPMLKKLLTGKAIATLGAITLVSAGAAAAATGTVPSPFSSDKAKEATAEHVPDVARDNVAKHSNDTDDAGVLADPTETTESTEAVEAASESTNDAKEAGATEGVGPDATGPAQYGLCTAFAAHAEHDDDSDAVDEDPTTTTALAVPFQNLTDAATAAGQTVEEFCADATPGRSDSAPGQSDESPSVTAPGHTGDTPSVTAPGQGDESPSATAPGHTGDNPSATAPGQGDESPSTTAPGHTGDNPSATAPGQNGDNVSVTAPASGEHGPDDGNQP